MKKTYFATKQRISRQNLFYNKTEFVFSHMLLQGGTKLNCIGLEMVNFYTLLSLICCVMLHSNVLSQSTPICGSGGTKRALKSKIQVFFCVKHRFAYVCHFSLALLALEFAITGPVQKLKSRIARLIAEINCDFGA